MSPIKLVMVALFFTMLGFSLSIALLLHQSLELASPTWRSMFQATPSATTKHDACVNFREDGEAYGSPITAGLNARRLASVPVDGNSSKQMDKHGKDAQFDSGLPFNAFEAKSANSTIGGHIYPVGLNPAVISAAKYLQSKFKSAVPFPHIEIDNFLTREAAEQLLDDFPAFESGNNLNEFGLPGLKSIRPDLRSISPVYSSLWKFLGSSEFLHTMSTITGIPDLLADPTMFGGGTHENKNGQNLNIHVDFNYNRDQRWHRRLNVLLYLNKHWENHWGGRIELHSNPWGPRGEDAERIYNISFNKVVIFATSENSWHGFKEIQLPPNIKDAGLTRKLVSIYLYTRDRPREEIAPAHGTFYVPDRVPEMCDGPAAKLAAGSIKYRDEWLQRYMKLEKDYSGQKNDLLRQSMDGLRNFIFGVRPFHITEGFSADGWVGPHSWLDAREQEGRFIRKVLVEGDFTLPEANGLNGADIKIIVMEERGHMTHEVGSTILQGQASGSFLAEISLERKTLPGQHPGVLTLVVDSGHVHGQKVGDDVRELAFRATAIKFEVN